MNLIHNLLIQLLLIMSIKNHPMSVTSYGIKKIFSYKPPKWWIGEETYHPKHGRFRLANLPTPLHFFPLNSISDSFPFQLIVKRDDMTGGVELGGNKVRKLEFLLSDAIEKGHDSVVTIGGEQSNHCRATATAARMLGLKPALVLRTKKVNDNRILGFTGNLLINRMMGSIIYTCTPGEYGRLGSNKLLDMASEDMRSKGLSPYSIPVGGSNAVGTWGYIEAVNELRQQLLEIDDPDFNVDHIVFACGSGGTAAGITIGIALGFAEIDGLHPPKVHAIGVCDDPEYFYKEIVDIGRNMGLFLNIEYEEAIQKVKAWVTVYQGKGKGYAISTQMELEFCKRFSMETGIALDPVYTGKALYHFIEKVVANQKEEFRDSNVLFWHTGGSLGMFDKGDEMIDDLLKTSPLIRIDAYGKKK